jgi:hypothetical protein
MSRMRIDMDHCPAYTPSAAQIARDYRPSYPLGYTPREVIPVPLVGPRGPERTIKLSLPEPRKPGITNLSDTQRTQALERRREKARMAKAGRGPSRGHTLKQPRGTLRDRILKALDQPAPQTCRELADRTGLPRKSVVNSLMRAVRMGQVRAEPIPGAPSRFRQYRLTQAQVSR